MPTNGQGQASSLARAKGQTTCQHHQGQALTLFCVSCTELVCGRCVTSVHQSHTLEELGAILPGKREELQTYIDTTGNIQLLQLKTDITAAEEELKRNASRFKDIAAQAKEQGDRLKSEIDILVTQSLAMCKQIEDRNAKLIAAYKKDLQTRYDVLKNQLQDQKKLLQKSSDVQIYDAEVDLFANNPLPSMPNLHTSNFMPNKNPKTFLEQALGNMNTVDPNEELEQEIQPEQKPQQKQKTKLRLGRHSKSQPSIIKLPSLSDHGWSTGSRMSFIKKPLKPIAPVHEERAPSARYRLCDGPTVLGEFESPCKVSAISCTPEGDAWVCFDDSKTLTLLGPDGNVKRQIHYQVRFCDVRISPITQNLWACSSADRSIIEWPVTGLPIVKFQTDMTPRCMCLSQQLGFVIIGMSKEMAVFTNSGRMVASSRIVAPDSGVTSPKRITECPLTNNLAVVDHDLIADGGMNKRHVIITDNKLKTLHRFRGATHHGEAPADGNWSFNPSDARFDGKGNLVISDCTNKSIMLISGSGRFISMLDLTTSYAVAVSLQEDNTVWGVHRMNGNYAVKLLEYDTISDIQEEVEEEEEGKDTDKPK